MINVVTANGEQKDLGTVTDEEIINAISNLDVLLDKVKTTSEQELEKLAQQKSQALDFIKSKATDEEKLSLIDLFEQFKENYEYQKDDEFQYNGSIYKVLQNHTSQPNWLPTNAPSLYVDIMNKVVIAEFKQPTGSHDSYQAGDKILFNGSVYFSIINNNTWSPEDYPQGWQKEVN